MIYLPFNEPDQCLRFVEQFSDAPGVVGFMVTAARYRPAHHNAYMKVYRALEERNLPIGFHAIFHEQERMFEGMNKFLSVHALGFIFYNLVHITNIVINGIPERFPNLKFLWIEGGLAWVPFLMQRLDNEYMMRTSEAPLLKKLPSDYMRDMFYTSQPIENRDLGALETSMRMMNAETQLMFASDYPHWDFNLPSTIYDLPFLSEQGKRQILGENARRVFNLDK
jgi:predicted TIM-barrel fold metal-dependent hydrolase